MTAKYDRDAVAAVNRIKIVEALADEPPEYWLVSETGEEFPVRLDQLHDLIHALHQLHDQAHHH